MLTSLLALTVQAQSLLHRVDSMLTLRYHKGNIDTAYVVRPQTKWTITAVVSPILPLFRRTTSSAALAVVSCWQHRFRDSKLHPKTKTRRT